MPFPRRVYDPPPATNEEIANVLRKLQIWRKELKGLDAVFPTLARVMPSDEWLAALGRPGGGGGPDGSPQKTAAGALRGLL